jgi:RNA polymerase sigma-70 factor, ECF subfamily
MTTTAATETHEDLLRRFREGRDPGALALLFDRTAPSLFRIALSVVPDAGAAEEAVQETFLALLEDPSRPDLAQPLMPWLVGVLRHKVLDARRRERRVVDPLALEPKILPKDPADEAARRDAVDRVRAALSRLEEPYRTVAMLRWEYGLEPGEIAHARGEPPGTVRSLLSRALTRLRGELGGGTALAIALGIRPPQGLAALRARVMTQAGFPTGTTALVVAGVAVSRVAAALALGVAFVAGGAAASAVVGRGDAGAVTAARAPDPPRDGVARRSSVRGPSRPRAVTPAEDANETAPAAIDAAAAAPSADVPPQAPPDAEMTDQAVRREAHRLLDGLSASWIEGWRVGRSLSKLRPAETVLDVLRERWSGLPSGVGRQNLLKGFSYDSTCELRLEVFDLGVRDPDPRVQDFALYYVAPYAGRQFLEDRPAYQAWRAAARGRTPESLLDESAERLVAASRTEPPASRAALVELLSDVVTKRGTPAVRDAALAAASVWIEDPEWLADPGPVLGLIADARPGPTWSDAEYRVLRSRGGECARRALLLAGRLRIASAFDDLVAGLGAADEPTAAAAASGLARLDDARALGPLVECLRARPDGPAAAAAITALEGLTLVSTWNGKDAAWWIAWWERNRSRYDSFLPKEEGR